MKRHVHGARCGTAANIEVRISEHILSRAQDLRIQNGAVQPRAAPDTTNGSRQIDQIDGRTVGTLWREKVDFDLWKCIAHRDQQSVGTGALRRSGGVHIEHHGIGAGTLRRQEGGPGRVPTEDVPAPRCSERRGSAGFYQLRASRDAKWTSGKYGSW